MGDEGRQNARQIVLQTRLAKLLQKYLNFAVVAVEARKLGLTVPATRFEEERAKSAAEYLLRGGAGARALRNMKAPESFYEHNLTNALLWQAYAEKVVRPTLKVSEEEIRERMERQDRLVLDAVQTNEFKRALIYDLWRQAKGGVFGWGKRDFAQIAEQWSDCPTCDTGGVFMDVNEHPQHIHTGDVRREMEAAYRQLQVGEVSEVVETPYSWHVLKLLARHSATEDEEESVELAHIMLEKRPVPPVMTADEARHRVENVKLRLAMTEKFSQLIKTAKINCMVPLFDEGSKSRKRKRSVPQTIKQTIKKEK